jgi:pimeloyl-ACP methyl ester carboxylesterase
MLTHSSSTPELERKRFTQPAAFVAGTADPVLGFDPTWRDRFPQAFDDLRFIELVEGAGHWVQVEQPAKTTALILRFVQGL